MYLCADLFSVLRRTPERLLLILNKAQGVLRDLILGPFVGMIFDPAEGPPRRLEAPPERAPNSTDDGRYADKDHSPILDERGNRLPGFRIDEIHGQSLFASRTASQYGFPKSPSGKFGFMTRDLRQVA